MRRSTGDCRSPSLPTHRTIPLYNCLPAHRARLKRTRQQHPSRDTSQSYDKILLSTPTHTRDRKGDYVLHRRVEGVDWILSRLAAPLLVALDRAHICVFYDDLVERAREA